MKVFLKYCGTTVINTAVNLLTYFLLRHFGVDVFIANLIAIVLEVPVSFALKYKYVFEHEEGESIWKMFVKFIQTRLASMGLECVLVPLFSLIMPDRLGKILVQVLLLLFNFLATKKYVFRQ